MKKDFTLCFEIYSKNGLSNSKDINHTFLNHEMLLSSLSQICVNFVFSFRYLYDPSDDQKLKLFLLINPLSEIEDCEIVEKIIGLLTKGNFSRFYNLIPVDEGFPELDWVTSIGEVIKSGEFINQSGFEGYLPHLFETDLADKDFSLIDLLNGSKYQNLILEFSLETYTFGDEQVYWSNAIDCLVKCLTERTSKNSSINYALDLYKKYQNNYSRNQLFNYSIKALGCDTSETFTILQTLIEVTSSRNTSKKINPIVTFNPNHPNFINSLQATKNVQVFKGVKWDGWEQTIGEKLEQQLIQRTVKLDGLLSSLDDGSMDFPVVLSSFSQLSQSILPSLESSKINDKTGDLVLKESSSLLKRFEPQLPKIEHLKPLHGITTCQEVVGFFQFFSTSISNSSKNFSISSAEEIFDKYRNLITRDTYIVGIDDNGNPIISSWAEIPHRLIAGLPGAGKTNFLNWVIFQFLYVNPRRRVYIADFGGVDFQYLNKLKLNIEIATTLETCTNLIEKIHREEYEERLKLMQNHCVSDLKLLQEEGEDIDRTLWIIDEAAEITRASSKLRSSIEAKLETYAQQGRKYGIQVLYCTQRPTTDVVTKQVTDQCEEKVIFRVTPDASQRILDDTIASNIPKDARGRAWLDGYAGRMFVNVPKMKNPQGTKIPISDTLWHRFITK